MKLVALLVTSVFLFALVTAGCTGTQPQTPATSPPTTVVTTITSTPIARPSFEIGALYDFGNYSFYSEKTQYVKEFRAENPWGIHFIVKTLVDDPQYSWFKLEVQNLDSGRNETLGYGREFASDLDQSYPIYGRGPYRITMTGNRVSVQVYAGERKA